ncbi:unnamed protein product, partial [Closterium sp. Naga37s-1]
MTSPPLSSPTPTHPISSPPLPSPPLSSPPLPSAPSLSLPPLPLSPRVSSSSPRLFSPPLLSPLIFTPPLFASSHLSSPLPTSVGLSSPLFASPHTTPPFLLSAHSHVLRVWRAADAVCFDVDSTVCVDEGIDELAAYCGAGEAVAAWTTKAMSGSVPFETALAARLEIFNPSAADVAGFLRDHPPRLNPGIGELVKRLKARGTEVYLISGGFRQMIEPVAALLDIPVTNIFANRLLFEEGSGAYAGFDANEPTSRSGGKARAIAQLKQEHGFKSLVMVGDGATDLE